MDDRQGAGAAPSDADLERAIASVPGVASASVSRSDETGRSRLRIRLSAGEDPEKVSWAVAATLRERFSIVLDPDAIRPREDDAEEAAEDDPTGDELAETRDRLSSAAREALVGLRARLEPVVTAEVSEVSGEETADDDVDDVVPVAASSDREERDLRILGRSHVGRPWPVPAVEIGRRHGRDVDEPQPDPAPRVPDGEVVAPSSEPQGELADAVTSPSGDPSDTAAPHRDAASAAAEVTGPDEPRERPQPTAITPPAPQGMPRRADTERAAIRHLDTRRDERDVRVTATLERGGRSARGEVTTVPTTHGVFRAVAEATIAALGVLVGPALVAGVDRVTVQPADDPANALVAVSILTDRGEERLLGTSIVRGDPEHAVMRATLDALNRRIGELFSASAPAPTGDSAA